MTRAEILLKINSDLQGIRKANEEFLRLRRETRAATTELSSFGRSLAGGLGIGAGFGAGAKAADLLLGGIRSLGAALKDTIQQGVRFNATLETAQLSVGAVLKQFNPEKYRTFGDATKEASTLVAELKQRALETSATFEELLNGFQTTAGVMTTAGVPLRKQIDLLVTTSQAMSALGINAFELRQELTALLMGNIDRNARLAKTLEPLGVNNESIARAREAGQLYEFLTEKMADFAAAGKLASNNIEVLESNLTDARTQVAADATQSLSLAYKDLLRTLTHLTQSDVYRKTLGLVSALASLEVFKMSKLLAMVGGPAPDGTPDSRPVANTAADEASSREAAVRALSDRLSKEAENAREEGVRKYAAEIERVQARIRAAAKDTNPAWYLDLLRFDKESLTRQLNGADSRPERYLGGGDASDPSKVRAAETAAAEFRFRMSGKIADIEKEIAATIEAQSRKPKAEQEQRVRAGIRLLQVQGEYGTLAEKITALEAEKSALNEQDLNYKADALAIEMKIAKLKDDEAARLNADNAKAIQRRQQAEFDAIRNDRFITERTKRQLLYNGYLEEQRHIEEKINTARDYAASLSINSPLRPQAEHELENLIDRRDVGIPNDLAQNKPLTMMEDLKAGLVSLVDSFATVGTLISDVIGSALQSVTANLTGLIMQTQTWGQALRNIGVTILSTVINAIVQASVQWVARKIIEFALGNTLRAAALAANLGTAIALSQIWATPATLATIATFGGAAVAAPGEIAGAMGAVHGMALFAKGGYTGPGGKYEVAGLAHKGEVIFSQEDVRRNGGVAAVEAMRVRGAGFMNGSSVASAVTGGPVEAQGGGEPVINQAFFGSQQDAEQWLNSHRGRRVMTDFVKGIQYELA